MGPFKKNVKNMFFIKRFKFELLFQFCDIEKLYMKKRKTFVMIF